VKSLCGHFMCEQCALLRSAKSGKCAVCEKPMRGVFNVADDIVKKFGLGKKAASQAAWGDQGGVGSGAAVGGWDVADPPEEAGGCS
jgi:hypothetical protein